MCKRVNYVGPVKVEGIWVTAVQVYALTEDSSVMVKDEFFQKLQETVGSVVI